MYFTNRDCSEIGSRALHCAAAAFRCGSFSPRAYAAEVQIELAGWSALSHGPHYKLKAHNGAVEVECILFGQDILGALARYGINATAGAVTSLPQQPPNSRGTHCPSRQTRLYCQNKQDAPTRSRVAWLSFLCTAPSESAVYCAVEFATCMGGVVAVL